MKINIENWTYTHYFSDPLRAFVSLGAAPIENSNEVLMQYLVTLTDRDYQELYQSVHEAIDEALLALNEKYGHWEFKDAGARIDGDGCSSCAAH
jgi:hypothetical protein